MHLNQFKSEADMQSWLSNCLEDTYDLADLITNKDYLDKFKPKSIEHKKILRSFKVCLESLYGTKSIIENENIFPNNTYILKPDFILYSGSTEGVVIIELKNIKNPTRQAGTEFNAYSSAIKSHLPFISDGDIYNVIISHNYPTLLVQYIFHEIFWKQRNFLCLTPSYSLDGINLEILSIESIYKSNEENKLSISAKSITGYHICLYNYENCETPQNILDKNIEQMKTSLIAMKSEGIKQHSHGFAILWKNKEINAISPYFITLCNLSAFSLFNNIICNTDKESSLLENKIFEIMNDICSPTGHSSTLFRITESGEDFLKIFCEPRIEISADWKHLYGDILDMHEEIISFQSWGFFGELFNERLLDKYSKCSTSYSSDDPRIGEEILTEFIDLHSNYDT